jgi:hypothetical protein
VVILVAIARYKATSVVGEVDVAKKKPKQKERCWTYAFLGSID